MSRFDFVIFGATGFTGCKAVEEIIRISKKYGPFTWAVAGRSEKKLQAVLAEASKNTGEDLSSIKTIIADVGNEESLKAMCAEAKVLVNCCGPYKLYGEPVVRAAIDSKTHHVDVSGESQYIETIQLEYDQQARDNGVYVVSACGFDSIPNDMGVVYLQKQFDGTLNSVESYISVSVTPEYREEARRCGLIHYGTWHSLVDSIATLNKMAPIRKKMFPERLPTFKPKPEVRGILHQRNGIWCVPFKGADGSIVYRSQRFFYEQQHQRPVHFKPYLCVGELWKALLGVIVAFVFFLMAKVGFTRDLLLQYPKFFSFGMITHEGPTEAVMNNTKFQCRLYGEGWSKGKDVEATRPDKKMAVVVRGVNPGYGATVTGIICSAVTILKEQDKMPGNGGVLTTAAAFKDTDLISKLHENNFTFSVLDD